MNDRGIYFELHSDVKLPQNIIKKLIDTRKRHKAIVTTIVVHDDVLGDIEITARKDRERYAKEASENLKDFAGIVLERISKHSRHRK